MLLALTFPLLAVAAGANEDAVCVAPFKCRIVSAHLALGAAVTANDTNYAILTLGVNDGAGGSFTTVATVENTTTADTGNLAVATPLPFVLNSAARNVADGAVIKLAKTYAGSGVAIEGTVVVLVEKIP